HAARVDQLLDERAVHEGHAANETELRVLAFGSEHPAVDPGEAHRRYAATEERSDDASVGETTQNRERDVACARVADAETTNEAGLHSQAFRPLADQRPTAVHHDEWMAGVVQRDDRVERGVVLGAHRSADLQHEKILTWCSRHLSARTRRRDRSPTRAPFRSRARARPRSRSAAG